MARVTTRSGDDGYTGLLGAGRVPKYHPRPEALGTVDEATSALGLARAQSPTPRVREVVLRLQRELYLLTADLATTAEAREKVVARLTPEHVAGLERLAEALKAELASPPAFCLSRATVSSA